MASRSRRSHPQKMPKDTKQQVRTPVRRAASKEALKQMQILLGDGKRYEISDDDDDDVIEVEVQPPKKKLKLTNKKPDETEVLDKDVAAPTMKVVVKNAAKQGDECPFEMEVTIEDLTSVQQTREETLRKEYKEVDLKVKELLAAPNHELVYNGVYTKAVQIVQQAQTIINAATTPAPAQFAVSSPASTAVQQQPVAGQSIVLQQPQAAGSTAMTPSYQLVMDPRLGMIVGTVSTTPGTSTSAPPLHLYPAPSLLSTTPTMPSGSTVLKQVPSNTIPPLQKATLQKGAKAAVNKTLKVKQPVLTNAGTITTKSLSSMQKPMLTGKGRPMGAASQVNLRPTENNVEGGLATGMKKPRSIDLTGEDGRALPDSREVSFNKLQGRTYPSLVVLARPHLRVKDLAADRPRLDLKVKSVLMYPPNKFTEWLIQQGLVRSDQKCSNHPNNPLKLGMYSDTTKFPYSGGYVWISECCPQRFVSVFSGSLFEGSMHPPMSMLKLLYHWCCQTIVQNVTQWVKVDNLYVKAVYTWLRSVCTVALHTHVNRLGGSGVKVQVGVISLGTTSQDGYNRKVKVEVLGVMETSTRYIRLRAVEPLAEGERNYKKRFLNILEPLTSWVHPASIIVTDLTVDKATLYQMGYMNVVQNTLTDYAQSNRTIMEYLRRIVPRMFQNTLSLLSRQIIQQFLDELVWREWYGTTVLQCFDNIVLHLSEQTRYDSPNTLIARLNHVTANPFKNWSITMLQAPKQTEPVPKRYNRKAKAAPTTQPASVQEVARPTKSSSPDVPEQMVPLENYYYGTITPFQLAKGKIKISIKCPFCKLTYNTNVALMNHLFKHAHNVSNDVQLCRYCLTIVPSSNDLVKHINTTHPEDTKFDSGFVCLICETQFRNPFILGKHMSKEHNPSELPYLCGTCGFRCSSHKLAVDHFYQQHDHGTTIQCPFCLKSTTIFSSGRNMSQNMNYFIQHLQKHQKKQMAKKCNKCVLWFIQREFLKDHQNKMHSSQRGKTGLVPSFAPRNGVMVPKSRMDKSPDDGKNINFSTLSFKVAANLMCKECEKPLTPKHFTSFENCQNNNCQYSTCCADSMRTHISICKQLNSHLPSQKLPFEMFCVCGYSDICGNMMAKHLAICERKSAYPSPEAAKNATVTHSMLDVLGLVRKPEEAAPSKQTPNILKPRGRPRKYPLATTPPITPTSKKPNKEVKNNFNSRIKEVPASVDTPKIKREVEDGDVAASATTSTGATPSKKNKVKESESNGGAVSSQPEESEIKEENEVSAEPSKIAGLPENIEKNESGDKEEVGVQGGDKSNKNSEITEQDLVSGIDVEVKEDVEDVSSSNEQNTTTSEEIASSEIPKNVDVEVKKDVEDVSASTEQNTTSSEKVASSEIPMDVDGLNENNEGVLEDEREEGVNSTDVEMTEDLNVQAPSEQNETSSANSASSEIPTDADGFTETSTDADGLTENDPGVPGDHKGNQRSDDEEQGLQSGSVDIDLLSEELKKNENEEKADVEGDDKSNKKSDENEEELSVEVNKDDVQAPSEQNETPSGEIASCDDLNDVVLENTKDVCLMVTD